MHSVIPSPDATDSGRLPHLEEHENTIGDFAQKEG
jgi:hypothetical protein